MMLVSLEEAKSRLRVDHDYDDSDIALLVRAASRAVFTYIKEDQYHTFTDENGEYEEDSAGIVENVPEDIKIATLYLIGVFYKDRDENPQEIFRPGFLPAPVTALLYPYRDPTLR